MLKAIIFDMDGVLIDSNHYILESFNALLKDSGVRLSNRDFKRCLGMSLRDQLESWEKEYGIKKYYPKEFGLRAAEIQLRLMRKNPPRNSALKKLINEAKAEHIKLAVATSSYVDRAEAILRLLGIEGHFDTVVTSEDVKKHKPNPDIFLRAAERLGEKPQDCVVFEDAANGVEAARRGGFKTVALITQFQDARDLRYADAIIDSFSKINLRKLKELSSAGKHSEPRKIKVVCVDFQRDFTDRRGFAYKPRVSVNFVKTVLIPFLRRHNLKIAEIISDYRDIPLSSRGFFCIPGTFGYSSAIPASVKLKDVWIKCQHSPIWVRDNIGLSNKRPGKPRPDPGRFNRWLSSVVGKPEKVSVVLVGMTANCCVLDFAQELFFRGYKVRILKEATDDYTGLQQAKDRALNLIEANRWASTITWHELRVILLQNTNKSR